mgnify:CR=1 FL=1
MRKITYKYYFSVKSDLEMAVGMLSQMYDGNMEEIDNQKMIKRDDLSLDRDHIKVPGDLVEKFNQVLKKPSGKRNEKNVNEIRKFRMNLINESLQGQKGKYTQAKEILKNTLGPMGELYEEKLKLKQDRIFHTMELPTINHLNILPENDDKFKLELYEVEGITECQDKRNQLKLLVPIAHTGRIEGVEHIEMFRTKFGGKKWEIHNR